jgi:hypothetical protein
MSLIIELLIGVRVAGLVHMPRITDEMRADFRAQGFVVVPGVLDADQVAAGRAMIAILLAEQPPADGPGISLWPQFEQDGHPLLNLYRTAGIADLAGQLLRPDDAVDEPESAQVAITIPPWPHRPGGPHVDGLSPTEPDGRPGTFSLLAGLWLSDQSRRDRGNLWIWPGTHLRFGEYLRQHGTDALTRAEEMNPGPYPKIELGDPVQAMGPAGSVLFAHYLLAHKTAQRDGLLPTARRGTPQPLARRGHCSTRRVSLTTRLR